MEVKSEAHTSSEHPFSIQEYLSLGYLFLILLGILDQIIYYKFLNINIVRYLSIQDVLLSPASTLFQDVWVIFFFLLIIIFAYYYNRWMYKLVAQHQNKSWSWIFKGMDKDYSPYASGVQKKKQMIQFIFVVFASAYLGIRIGTGNSVQKRIETGNFKISHQLQLTDSSTKNVYVVGQNSMYLFYVAEQDSVVTVMPIADQIRTIRKLRKTSN